MSDSKFNIDFIGIGAPKCGTSWIAQCLKEHPKICFSNVKEIKFFNKIKPFYRKNEECNYKKGIKWYEKHFAHCDSSSVKGEFSVYYLMDPDAPRLIKKHYPDTKIIIALRNPVDRIYSHYLHAKAEYKTKRGINLPSFENIIKNEKEFLEYGYYSKYIKNYFSYFNRKNILIVFQENIKANPEFFIKKIYAFLNVNNNFVPPSCKNILNDTAHKLSIETRLFYAFNKNTLNTSTRKAIVKFLKFFGINKILLLKIQKITSRKQKYNDLDIKTRHKLKKIYIDDVVKLEKLLSIDLKHWK